MRKIKFNYSKTDSYKIKRFIEITVTSYHIPITQEEYNEIEKIREYFGIEACSKCQGVGGFEVPSMEGYGWELYDCTNCNGHGEILPERIKTKLDEIKNPERDEMGEYHGRNL